MLFDKQYTLCYILCKLPLSYISYTCLYMYIAVLRVYLYMYINKRSNNAFILLYWKFSLGIRRQVHMYQILTTVNVATNDGQDRNEK